jgi:hypothetical protein
MHPLSETASQGLRDSLPLLYVQFLAHDDHQRFSFLFRLRQPRNNCSKFIEYLLHGPPVVRYFSKIPFGVFTFEERLNKGH